jgi:hypothetical protein
VANAAQHGAFDLSAGMIAHDDEIAVAFASFSQDLIRYLPDFSKI